MLNQNARALIVFTKPWDFCMFRDAVENKRGDGQVCSAFTQIYRLSLVLQAGMVTLRASERKNNQWLPRPLSPRVSVVDADTFLLSQEHMQEYLRELFFMQWPKAEELFFDSFPDTDYLLTVLHVRPVLDILHAKQLFYTIQDDARVDDADGIATALVSEGKLMVPFTRDVQDNEATICLQVERAKLHPSSPIQYYGEKFFLSVDHIISNIRSFSWSRIRDIIEQPFLKGD